MANPATKIAPGDVTAPAVPGAPVVVPYGRGLQVSVVGYSPPTDFFRYRYFKNGVVWRESPTLSQIDYDVSYGTTYQYTVAAIDTALPANVSAQSGIGSGVPQPHDTPDIKPLAVTDVNFSINLSVNQLRDATQPTITLSQLSVSRNIVGSNGVLIMFSARFTVSNGVTAGIAAGATVSVVRDGVTTVSGAIFSASLAPAPQQPGTVNQFTIPVTVVDFPGAGTHTYTVQWSVVSTHITTLVTVSCDQALLEIVELKR